MSTNPTDLTNRIQNYDGSKWLVSGKEKRAHRAVITLKGVEIEVEYLTDGGFLPATADEPACYPCCLVKSASIGGVECLRLLDEEEIATRVEQQWVEG